MKPEFNFKKYQNLKKSWKMIIRFIIYSVVIAFLSHLIFNAEKQSNKEVNEEQMNEINIGNEDILVN